MARLATQVDDFRQRLLLRLGRRAAAVARRQIPSGTLRRALRVSEDHARSSVVLEIPHYWAVYVHDGRGVVRPRRPGVRFVAFYKDPADDPRMPSQTVRASQIRRLRDVISRAEFVEDARRGKIVFARRVRAVRGTPFFEEGLRVFNTVEAPRVISAEFDRFVREVVSVGDARSVRIPLS